MVLINKIDLSNQGQVMELYNYWKDMLPAADVFAISATEKFNIAPIFDGLLSCCLKDLRISRKMS